VAPDVARSAGYEDARKTSGQWRNT
jgi:hypothetical protein